MIFFVGLHQPSDAQRFERACVSVRRLTARRKPLGCPEVLLDSGAFSELALHGGYQTSPADYAVEIRRLHDGGIVKIVAAVAQDYMCEPFMLAKTGLTVEEHQRLTIERYDALLAEHLPVPVMPVLQGYRPSDYVHHLRAYGDRLTPGMWVGVGSVCKRNGAPEQIVAVLHAIKAVRPDLRLHGFGVKQTALTHPGVREYLYSADSMAWSFAARKQGRNPHDWREAQAFVGRIGKILSEKFRPWQMPLLSLMLIIFSGLTHAAEMSTCKVYANRGSAFALRQLLGLPFIDDAAGKFLFRKAYSYCVLQDEMPPLTYTPEEQPIIDMTVPLKPRPRPDEPPPGSVPATDAADAPADVPVAPVAPKAKTTKSAGADQALCVSHGLRTVYKGRHWNCRK